MRGDTFIGGITSHRDQFYCEKCGHIQWNSFISGMYDYYTDHIKCEICGSKKMKSKSDIRCILPFMHGLVHLAKDTTGKDRETIGEIAHWNNILHEMELRQNDKEQ